MSLRDGRDDLGRTDESPGFDIQARVFAGIGAFLFVASVVYGFWTYEWAGTTMLVLAGGFATLVAAYLGVNKPTAGATVAEAEHGQEADAEAPWFPAASLWPFLMGIGAALFANGLLLGTWLLFPAAVVLLYAIGGFVRQSRRRD